MASLSLLSTKDYEETLHEPAEIIVKSFESVADRVVAATASCSHGRVALSATLVTGLHTVLHVFRTILLYTRSLELAAHYAGRAGVYFSEFVTQISDDGQHYLQLTPKDAVLFSYKKTIYDLNSEHRSKFEMTEEERRKMSSVSAALTLAVRVRCRDLEESIAENGAGIVGDVIRRHKGFAAGLCACSLSDIMAISDFVDMATSAGLTAMLCRSWATAIIRRARRKGGKLDMARGRRLMATDLSKLTPAKVAAEIVV